VEKVLYPLWKRPEQDVDVFRDQLVGQLGPELAALEAVHGVRLAVADTAVAAAAGRRMENHAPVPDAMLSLWVDYATADAPWLTAIAARVDRMSAYLVAEAEPLVADSAHPCAPGERRFGMCHVVFLKRPATQSREEWLAVWKDSHTQVAIATQSTFGYRQNVVVRVLGDNAVPCDAIVEEHFPPEAMTSDHAFYATAGDEALLQAHMTAMMDSVARFIDFEHIDVIPMSEYLLKDLCS
jgi:hypothetical protein